MRKENTTRQPRKVLRTVFRALALGIMLVIVTLVAWHFVWKYSGSSQWKPEMEKNGVTIYSVKVPGRSLKDWKAVRRLETSLNGAVAAMTSTTTEDCAYFNPNCVSIASIQPWDPRKLSYIHLYRVNVPAPMSPRELLVKVQASQDPKSKAVFVEVTAHPDDLPKNDCCVRLTEYHTVWQFTPLGNGETEAELRVHMDHELPYFMINRLSPGALYSMFSLLPPYFSRAEFQQAKFDSIVEK